MIQINIFRLNVGIIYAYAEGLKFNSPFFCTQNQTLNGAKNALHSTPKKKWKNIDFHEILFAFKSVFLPIFSVSLTIVQNPLCRIISFHNKSIIATQRRIIYGIIFHGISLIAAKQRKKNEECQVRSFHSLC